MTGTNGLAPATVIRSCWMPAKTLFTRLDEKRRNVAIHRTLGKSNKQVAAGMDLGLRTVELYTCDLRKRSARAISEIDGRFHRFFPAIQTLVFAMAAKNNPRATDLMMTINRMQKAVDELLDRLSPKTLAIITDGARGKKNMEIAADHNCGLRTVELHRNKYRAALRAAAKAQGEHEHIFCHIVTLTLLLKSA